jgi:hypothetical protein
MQAVVRVLLTFFHLARCSWRGTISISHGPETPGCAKSPFPRASGYSRLFLEISDNCDSPYKRCASSTLLSPAGVA